ncbi:hypothetical protein [Leucothrix pacifica]|uniref:Uncharacterized protein n=1 Tax=Leucothrix pacifica TaxID=1247513 RepID=A0A317CG57_9GAMM|nr:hypothetical protein [Leucothrix pacifica]PWQ97141.1 hypothetical protein DKW60_11340 [Leucothrix pacifica]
MSTLAIALMCFVLVYIGFLVFASKRHNKSFVLEKINTVNFGSPRQGAKISTVVLSNDEGVKEAGLFVAGFDYVRKHAVDNTETFPLTISDVNGAIAILKQGGPFTLNLGTKNQFSLKVTPSSQLAILTIRNNAILKNTFRIEYDDAKLKELLAAFENLITTDKVDLKLNIAL